ncbi:MULTISPECIES: LexA family protein [Larkinella]|jgi:DNA polymerase V|uniref:Peptidase S24 n=1 Tax=Larkinella punicea TaxID=2315727 RepID=A0A368JKH5_9BACT|nr:MULTISPECIES: translesion error-prone DNA polymerase V autoproteolytic subunit [Larkinella]RCR67053.1 peptidase S24 [Larkinella punicea]
MIEFENHIRLDDIRRIAIGKRLKIPLFSSYVSAGFPNSSEHYITKVCDLNDLCIANEDATYFVRVRGDSMSGDRIDDGDFLIVDSSQEPSEDKIVVVILNGEHAVKRIHYVGEMVVLESSNPKYLPIYIHPGDDFRVFGVVTRILVKPV